MAEQKNLFELVKLEIEQLGNLFIADKEALEKFRIEYIGTKSKLKDFFGGIKEVPNEQKKEYGLLVNELKQKAENIYEQFKSQFETVTISSGNNLDLSKPADPLPLGSRHPIQLVKKEIVEIFTRIGYVIEDGPEIEDDWHNFTALNFPPEHPARDMQDTYFISEDKNALLRTHTSTVQVRVMQNQKPPIRSIMPGRVFRNETISARSHCFFHQIEGLYIDKGVSFADLKQTLLYFAKEMFGATKIRLRPSYFPFTEPSAEMDIWKGTETEADYRITKGTGWLEVLGCGMVDPNVLKNCGIDPEEYSGFAFGMGVDRMALLKYQIPDIRLLSENDVRFLNQLVAAT
jgi:phenylalanyl-tRNA synthetase alpha chain